MPEPTNIVAFADGSLLLSLPDRFSFEREEDGTLCAFLADSPDLLSVRFSAITVEARTPQKTAEIDLSTQILARGRDSNRSTESFGGKAWFYEDKDSEEDGRRIWLRFWHVGYRNHHVIVSFCCEPQHKGEEQAVAALNLIPRIIADLNRRDDKSPLTEEEKELLDEQRSVVGELLRTRYDCFSLPKVEADLPILQQLIDDRAFSPEQEYEWACVGVVFGDVIAGELELDWIAYCDEHGAEPALYLPQTSITLFPRSMILKRVEEEEWPDLNYLLNELRGAVDDLKQQGC